MVSIERSHTLLRFFGVVFPSLWLFFSGVFFLIRGSHLSNTRLILLSALVSVVTTLCAFGMRWLMIRKMKED